MQIAKLQQLGMTPSEEAKLLALRDYIVKLATAISRCFPTFRDMEFSISEA